MVFCDDLKISIQVYMCHKTLLRMGLCSHRSVRVPVPTPVLHPQWLFSVGTGPWSQLKVLPWPLNSPDLSPIEHLWDMLEQQVQSVVTIHRT